MTYLKPWKKMVRFYELLVDNAYAIAARVCTGLNQVLHDKPEFPSQTRFLRRLNWVEQTRDMKELISRTKKMNDRNEVIKQARDNISSIVRIHKLNQGKSTGNVSSTDKVPA